MVTRTAPAFFLLLACAATPPALLPPGYVGLDDMRLAPRTETLPDGLRLVHERLEGSGAAALVLTVRAGAARDPEGRRGLAHLVEHLTFRARDDAGETLWDRYERLGVFRVNAFTDHESTVFVAVVPKVSLAAALALEAGRLRSPLRGVTDEELAVEREVVRNELVERNERNLEGALLSWSAAALFPPDHRYRAAVGGTSETLGAIARRDATFFATRYYRPRNATLTVVGDFTPEELRAAAAKAFAGQADDAPEPLPDIVEVPLEPPIPPPPTPTPQESGFAGPRLWIAWTVPGTYGAMSGFGEVLARVLNSSVQLRHLERRGGADIAELSFFTAQGLMASTLFAEAHLRTGEAPEASARAIIDAVAAVARPTEADGEGTILAGAIVSVLSSLVLQTEDLLTRASRYAEADRVSGNAGHAGGRLKRVAQVGPQSFRDFVGAYLTTARARLAVVTPRKSAPRPAPTGLDQPTRSSSPASGGAPAAVSLPSPREARRLRLGNGLEVVLWPRPGFPAITAALAFRGGRAIANPPGAEFYFEEILPLRYCGGLPMVRGIEIGTEVRQDAVVETARGGAGNISAILLSLAERAAAYRFDRWEVLERLRRQRCPDVRLFEERQRLWQDVLADGQQRLETLRLASRRSAGRLAYQALARALLGGTPYEPPGRQAVIDLRAEELEDWYASSRRPESALLAVVGQFNLEEGERLVRAWFGSWRPERVARAPRTPVVTPSAPPRQMRLYQVIAPGSDQAQLLAGCRVESGNGAADRVLGYVLSRELRRRLRDELGATYGVAQELAALKLGSSMLVLHTDVARAQLGGAVAEVVQRLDALAATPPPPPLVRKAQLDVMREVAGPASSPRLVDRLTHNFALGRPIEDLDALARETSAVSAEAVRAAAASCRRSLTLAAAADQEAFAALARSAPAVVLEAVR
jgi:zinc protease